MDIQVVDISAVLGLFAMATLTINVLLGMLLSTAYKINPVWKRLPAALKVINVNRLHNLTAYIALGLVLLHPLLLTFDSRTKFTVADIFYPVHAPHQQLIVSLGTISLFAIITVIITTQKKIKKKIKFRLWKNIHFISYGTAMLFIVHGLKMDPELKDRPTDWLDGEKLLCWACLLILMAATFLRIQYHNRTIRNRS
jgi:sulfoxide reductase heme-binding subunit YedZ